MTINFIYFIIILILFIAITIWREIEIKKLNDTINFLNDIINEYANKKGNIRGILPNGIEFAVEKTEGEWGFSILIKGEK